ncbi:Transposase and inactivated derivatives [Mannheimia haemolytica]|uniref:Transposase and inactivated derivatives n=1 Tax=Mannheimia haemolytica TaxID=75985 RepID=A0A378N903_MANHA|nr:Transposase and inactivated derivatives [Mannheimia haemolytica]
MKKETEIRRGRHVVFNLHVHLVFVTKYRREVFTQAILNDLHSIFATICADFEATLVEFDGEDDHVHLLVEYPPKVAISHLVNSLKGVSSRMIRKKNYPSIRKKLWEINFGHRLTLLVVVVVHQYRLFANISSNNKHLIS